MIYANAVPIAHACQMGQDVVQDILNTIFLAVQDMIKYDYNIMLQFGFCTIHLVNKSCKAVFAAYLN
jgi:hypothetical protein